MESGLSLAPTTVRVVFQHLNALLDAAVEDRLIMANPAKGVKLPERSGAEVVPPTVEQVQAIYEAAAEWFRPAVLLGAGFSFASSHPCTYESRYYCAFITADEDRPDGRALGKRRALGRTSRVVVGA